MKNHPLIAVHTAAPAARVTAAIIGAGPAGLMAAQVLSQAGVPVDVFDAMPSAGRKFLLAGKGGLNLTHSEPLPAFIRRYGARQAEAAAWLQAFGPQAVREWAAALGVATFVGTSGRVFPQEMKAAPLLRAWLRRLRQPASGGAPVRLHMRHRCVGTQPAAPETPGQAGAGVIFHLETPDGARCVQASAGLLALGGASWPRLGSDGAWTRWLAAPGVTDLIAPLRPANCGFDAAGPGGSGWSPYFAQRFAGQPLKSVALRVTAPGTGPQGAALFERQGEFVVTATGVEGSLIYAASALLRETIAAHGHAVFWLDLLPARSAAQVQAALLAPRGSQSLASHLRKKLRLDAIKTALLHELLPRAALRTGSESEAAGLAAAIKALPVRLTAPRPVQEAISTAGGVRLEHLTDGLMLRRWPGLFCAGEMLDWEAPTGGYLLTACLASGHVAGQAMRRWLQAGQGADFTSQAATKTGANSGGL